MLHPFSVVVVVIVVNLVQFRRPNDNDSVGFTAIFAHQRINYAFNAFLSNKPAEIKASDKSFAVKQLYEFEFTRRDRTSEKRT